MSKLEKFQQLLEGSDLNETQKGELLVAFQSYSEEIQDTLLSEEFIFNELHVHTENSMLDGVNPIPDYINKAVEFGSNALSISDHRVTHGFFKMRKASEKGIKPLFSCEVEVSSPEFDERKHAVLMAETNEGLENLHNIVSWGHVLSGKSKPSVTKEIIEQHKEGLICLSACIGGILGKPMAQLSRSKQKDKKARILQTKSMHSILVDKISTLEGEIALSENKIGHLTDEQEEYQTLVEYRDNSINELEKTMQEVQSLENELIDLENESARVTDHEFDVLEAHMEEEILYWANLFPNKFFLEVQNYDAEVTLENEKDFIYHQNRYNEILFKYAEKLNLPLVATNDVHYVNPSDALVQDVLICISRGKTVDDPDRFKFDSRMHYMKSKFEMLWRFKNHPTAVLNTKVIADMCNVTYNDEYLLPTHPHIPEGVSQIDFFKQRTMEGLKAFYSEEENYLPLLEKFNCTKPELWKMIKKRAEYEMSVLLNMGFEGYILIVSRCVEIAHENGYLVGHGRGSAAGSIVCLAHRITNVCPLRYDLIFERFLNPDRIEMPDVDVDYQYEYRGKVIEQVSDEIGCDNVAQIVTFGKMKARAAIRNVGKCLNIPLVLVDKVAKAVPFGCNITKAIAENPVFAGFAENTDPIQGSSYTLKDLVHISRLVEGKPKNHSIHAAGVILSGTPLKNVVSLQRGKSLDVIQAEMGDVDGLRLVKQDFLGLRNLSIIDQTIKLVKERHGIDIDPYRIPRNDAETFKMLARGESIACFQLESAGMRQLLKDIHIEKLEDVIDCIALYRPGVLSVGMHNTYVKNKFQPDSIEYLHPLMEQVLAPSRGILIYQEQAMMLANVLAGFSMADADKLRKAIGKKKEDLMAILKGQFVEGCLNVSKIKKELAEEIWHLIEVMSGYSFNKSHSVGYAFTTNDTAYLKCHYPIEYMTSAISVAAEGKNPKLPLYIQEAKRLGFNVKPPQVNTSEVWFSIKNDEIVFGLHAIKDVGKVATQIVEERNLNGDFEDIFDFRKRCQFANKKVLRALILAGCFDEIGDRVNRFALDKSLEDIIKIKAKKPSKSKKAQPSNQIPLPNFNAIEFTGTSKPIVFQDIPAPTKDQIAEIEETLFSTFITYHPLEESKEIFDTKISHSADDLENLQEGQIVVVGGLVRMKKAIRTKTQRDMAVYSIDDMTGIIDAVAFPNQYEGSEEMRAIKEKDIVLIKGKVQFKEKFSYSNNSDDDSDDETSNEKDYDIQIIIDSMVIFDHKAVKSATEQTTTQTPVVEQPVPQQIPTTKSQTVGNVINLQQYLQDLGYAEVVVL